MTRVWNSVKIALKDREDNKVSTISTQFTPESLKIIHKIISSQKIRDVFDTLDLNVDNYIYTEKMSNVISILLCASLCYLLVRLDDIKKNPVIYQRIITLQYSENILKKIYDTSYKEDSKK